MDSRLPPADHGARLESEYRPTHPLDLIATVGIQRHGSHDPAMVLGPVIWRAIRTPAGVATLALRQDIGGAVRAAAWGPGREWAIAQVPSLCGAHDDPDAFDPGGHPLVAEAHRRRPGLRLGRTDLIFEALASAVFEQKVTGLQAFGAWRRILSRHGEPAPGPVPRPMFAPPSPAQWRVIPSWSWQRAGVEPPQSRTVVTAAARAGSIERALSAVRDGAERDRVLTALPGVGLWTSAETRIRAFGDPDAVSVGDYHLAHEIGFALTGRRTDDAGMIELLQPWAGQRQRVIRLLRSAGPREPRRGPRLAPQDHRAH